MMHKHLLKLLFFSIQFLYSTGLFAQQQVNGMVLDDQGIPIPELPVLLKQPWGSLVTHTLTDAKGNFSLQNIPKGGYKIEIAFMGFENYVKEITINNSDLNLGLLQLISSSKILKEVTVKDKKLPAKVVEDTLQFDASSYKVSKDASAEDLLEKMPSVTKENGRMKSQNEEVKKVLIDGKPFFGDDPSLSLKNLPAEIVDKVQIFDQQSEQSQFTGINDGNTVKTINIVTKSGLNNGQFGKVYAGYTLDNHYQAGGNVNYFNGNQRISLIAMSNDINIQNFSTEDILGALGNSGNRDRGRNASPGGGSGGRFGSPGSFDFYVPQSGGIAQTHAIGLNYSDAYKKIAEWSVSYFFNDMRNNIESQLDRTYFTTGQNPQTYSETTQSRPDNTNHRIQGKLDLQLDTMTSIQIRPRISFQRYQNPATNLSTNFFNNIPGNSTDNILNTNTDGLNFSNNVLFRHKFSKPRRTFSIDWNINHAPKDDQSYQYSESAYRNPSAIILDTINQLEDNLYRKNGWSANLEFTEPVNNQHALSLNYRYQQSKDATEIYTFDLPQGEKLDTSLNIRLSNYFVSDNNAHQIGLGYQWNIQQKLSFSARANWQASALENHQYRPLQNNQTKYFYNFIPSMFLRYTISNTKNLMVHYRTFSQLPSIDQLQNVVNNSNPIRLTTGNPGLKQAFQHSASIRYNATLKNSNLLFASIRFNLTEDYITNHTYIRNRTHPLFKILSIPLGTQLIIPENAGSSYQVRSYFTFTYPWTNIKSILSIDLGHTYLKTPGLLDGNKIASITNNLLLGVTFNSNISDKIDYNLQFRPSYNTYSNSNSEDKYWLYEGKLRVSYQFYKKFVVKTDGTYRNNNSLQSGYNGEIILLNVALGMKLFKNERGELAIGVNDLFNQNQNIQRNITELYFEDTYSNNLQRFVMVSFTYNIRNFNTGKKADNRNRPDDFQRRPYDGPRF